MQGLNLYPLMPFDQFLHEQKEYKDGRNIVSVSLNPTDRIALDIFKEVTGVNEDSKALKLGVLIAKNSITSLTNNKFQVQFIKNKKTKLQKLQEKEELL